MPPSYIKLEKFCRRQCRIYNSELDGVNCLIHVFLQTHNLQRMIFKIFSQSRKIISNNVKKTKTKLASMESYNYPLIFHIQTFRDKKLLNIKSTFPFFSRCCWRSFLHKSISWFNCCVRFLNVSFISSVGRWLPWL